MWLDAHWLESRGHDSQTLIDKNSKNLRIIPMQSSLALLIWYSCRLGYTSANSLKWTHSTPVGLLLSCTGSKSLFCEGLMTHTFDHFPADLSWYLIPHNTGCMYTYIVQIHSTSWKMANCLPSLLAFLVLPLSNNDLCTILEYSRMILSPLLVTLIVSTGTKIINHDSS